MKSRASLPCRVCTSWVKRNISSVCTLVTLDVARTGSNCALVGCLLLETKWCALDGVTILVEDANISVSTLPLSGGRNPLLMSKDWMPIGSVDVRHEVTGWNGRKEVEEGKCTLVYAHAYIHETCLFQRICHAWVRDCAHIQWCAHGLNSCFWSDHAPHTPYFSLFACAWCRSLSGVACMQPHIHVQTCPSLCNFQWPQMQGTCSSLENFCSLASW